tara:strand:- start:90 stop:1136 length:1047 start_codon:yes stop_codon:yes gene_type:complete
MAAYTTIDNPGDFFNILLYTGTGSSNVLTGVGFQSDFIWTATRNEAEIRPINDSVNGINSYSRSNADDTLETTGSNITAQSSDGYTVGTEDRFNQSSNTFVSWNWKGGTTSGITTNGSTTITPSAYSFDQTAGFSCIKYTGNGSAGAKLAHGLGAVPDFMIYKHTDETGVWQVYHQTLGNTKWMNLNETDSVQTGSTRWNDTTPDSVNVTLGTTTYLNKSSGINSAYIFAEKQGYSKFGDYMGNGSSDGLFVYTGFRPSFLLVKRTDGTANWVIWDDNRDGYNTTNDELYPNTTAAEGTGNVYINFYSNGFKWLVTDSMVNGSGDEYIYAAFAHSPLTNSEGVANNAR